MGVCGRGSAHPQTAGLPCKASMPCSRAGPPGREGDSAQLPRAAAREGHGSRRALAGKSNPPGGPWLLPSGRLAFMASMSSADRAWWANPASTSPALVRVLKSGPSGRSQSDRGTLRGGERAVKCGWEGHGRPYLGALFTGGAGGGSTWNGEIVYRKTMLQQHDGTELSRQENSAGVGPSAAAAMAAASGSSTYYSVRSSEFPFALRANMEPYGQPTRAAAEQNTLPSLTLLRAGLHRCCIGGGASSTN